MQACRLGGSSLSSFVLGRAPVPAPHIQNSNLKPIDRLQPSHVSPARSRTRLSNVLRFLGSVHGAALIAMRKSRWFSPAVPVTAV